MVCMSSMISFTSMNQKQPQKWIPILYALLAAVLYGISAPFSKRLLETLPSTLMASLLYLGAGFGMLGVQYFRRFGRQRPLEAKLTSKEAPAVIAMILLDILAPILLMIGLTITSASNASLLNNFEIVATASTAYFAFHETMSRSMLGALGLITLASLLLSVQDLSALSFSWGSGLILLACVAWGFENNVTRLLSVKDPIQIVVVKGFGSGIGALILSLILKETSTAWVAILMALLLGCVAYGFSLFFYISAQRDLGAARTSAYYASAPFIGVLVSTLVFREDLTAQFLVALVIMVIATIILARERHQHFHTHPGLTHSHPHSHEDGHHTHPHDESIDQTHTHEHTHDPLTHDHVHTPDIHHSHPHS